MQISGISVHNHTHNLRANASTTGTKPGIKPEGASAENEKDEKNKVSGLDSSNIRRTESELDQAQLKQLRELRARDREVRAHEQAHAGVAGSIAKGGPSFSYQRGPDGQLYAVGGEVQIDISAVSGDPQATVQKAQQIRRAALAPAQPSSQDRAVAAQAAVMESQARVELAELRAEDARTEISGETQEGGSAEQEKAAGSSQDVPETAGHCASCGGQHSSGSHAVTEQVRDTFNVGDMKKDAGELLNLSV